jgi:hypothetical protein
VSRNPKGGFEVSPTAAAAPVAACADVEGATVGSTEVDAVPAFSDF